MRPLATLIAFAAALPAFAQDGRPAERALAPLADCRRIADPRARAGCYDAALDRLQQAVSTRQIVILDREQARAGRNALGPIQLREGTAVVDSTITQVIDQGGDLWTIRLATGAVWRTVEPDLRVVPRIGADVHVRRGAFGSYLLHIGKGWSVRAVRVN